MFWVMFFFFSVQNMVLIFWKHRSHLVSRCWKATVPTKNKVVGLVTFRTLFVGVGIMIHDRIISLRRSRMHLNERKLSDYGQLALYEVR